MVHQQDRQRAIGPLQDIIQRDCTPRRAGLGAVVAAADDDALIHRHPLINQQADARSLQLGAELGEILRPIIVIAQDPIGAESGAQPAQLGGHPPGHERTEVIINNIAGEQDQVRLKAVDHIDQFPDLTVAVHVAVVRVGDQHHVQFAVRAGALGDREGVLGQHRGLRPPRPIEHQGEQRRCDHSAGVLGQVDIRNQSGRNEAGPAVQEPEEVHQAQQQHGVQEHGHPVGADLHEQVRYGHRQLAG